jgi:hypothetical protein
MSRIATYFRRAGNPPQVVNQSMQAGASGPPEIDNAEGGITLLGPAGENQINPLANLPVGEIVNPLMELLEFERQVSMAPLLMMGQSPGAQMSGSAVDILSQLGAEKWIPVPEHVQNHGAGVGADALYIVQHYSPLLGREGNRGHLSVPRRIPSRLNGGAPAHELTGEMIERSGTDVTCKLTKFNITALAGAASALAIVKGQLGVIQRRTIVDILGFTEDPERELQGVEDDLLEEVAEIRQANTMENLYKQMLRAKASGDDESLRRVILKAKRVAHQMDLAEAQQQLEMQQLAMQGLGIDPAQLGLGGGAGAAPEEGMEPAGAMPVPGQMNEEAGDPNVAPYLSAPAFQGETGTEGGAPAGEVVQ